MSSEPSNRRRPYSLLTPDQLTAIEHATDGDLLLVGKMGSGKTVIAATAIADQLQSGRITRCLIVTTPRIAGSVWAGEFAEWEHLKDIRVSVASGAKTAEQRISTILEDDAPVVVTTFNLLPWLKENRLFDHFDGLVIDESTKLTSAGGKHTTSLKHAAKRMSWRLGLTGTPVSEGPDKLYSQLLLVDNGKSFGTRKESFLNTWFYPKDFKQRNWELKPHLKEAFYKQAAQSIHIIPDYRHELPPINEHVIDIKPPHKLIEATDTFLKTSALPGMSSPTAGTDTQKLAQLACGFYYDDGGDVCWISRFRLDAAINLINSLNRTVILVYNFIPEKQAIMELCPQAEPLTDESIVRWNAGEIEVLLLHPASCGHGIELQHGGHTIIWLTNQWSRDKNDQLNARIWRRGQKKACDIYSFRCAPIDDRMAQRITDKGLYDLDFNKGV